MSRRLAGALLAIVALPAAAGPALAAGSSQADIAVTKGVGTSHDGSFGPSLTAATGSTAWYRITVSNGGQSDVWGITLADTSTGDTLPAGCAGIPSPLAPGAVYTCIYRLSVAPGTSTTYAVASYGGTSSSAIAVVTGTGTGQVGPQPAGLWSSANGNRLDSAGAYTPATERPALGAPVTWQATLGSDFAGLRIDVYVARKGTDGSWGPFEKAGDTIADATGTVRFTWHEDGPAWLSVHFTFDATSTNSVQARWR